MTTELPEEKPNAMRISCVNAFIWTGINVFIFLITYYAAPGLFSNTFYSVASLLTSIVLAVYFIKDIRAKIGGYWSFREALKYIFVLFFIQTALTMIFTTAFGKWIEPSYIEMRLAEARNEAVENAEKMFRDQDQIDAVVEQSEQWSTFLIDPDLKAFLLMLGIMVIFYFIGALIFAAIFKRERPVFITDDDL